MKINDLLTISEETTSSAVAHTDVCTKEPIKRTFMQYTSKAGAACPTCDFIKKNNVGYASTVKCYLCDKSYHIGPKNKKENI